MSSAVIWDRGTERMVVFLGRFGREDMHNLAQYLDWTEEQLGNCPTEAEDMVEPEGLD